MGQGDEETGPGGRGQELEPTGRGIWRGKGEKKGERRWKGRGDSWQHWNVRGTSHQNRPGKEKWLDSINRHGCGTDSTGKINTDDAGRHGRSERRRWQTRRCRDANKKLQKKKKKKAKGELKGTSKAHHEKARSTCISLLCIEHVFLLRQNIPSCVLTPLAPGSFLTHRSESKNGTVTTMVHPMICQ